MWPWPPFFLPQGRILSSDKFAVKMISRFFHCIFIDGFIDVFMDISRIALHLSLSIDVFTMIVSFTYLA